MKRRPLFLATATLLAGAVPAQAHIVLQNQEAQIGTTFRAVLVVGHGCQDAATTAVRVQIPEGFYNVRPMLKAGWTVETVRGPHEPPFESHGSMLEESVKEISWSGGEQSRLIWGTGTNAGDMG